MSFWIFLVCNIWVGQNRIEFSFCYIADLVYLKQLLCQVENHRILRQGLANSRG